MSIANKIIEIVNASKKISSYVIFLNIARFINFKVVCRNVGS